VSESLILLIAGLGGVLLGALLVYGALLRSQRNLLSARSLALEVQHQEQLHQFALRDASLQQELKQLRLVHQERERELNLLREQLQSVTQKCSAAQQVIAGLREKELQAQELKQQLTRKEQQLMVLEVNAVELKTTLAQERKNFNEQLQLLQNAKLELVKEFENIANKIFEAKQQSFSQSSKVLLDASLDPLRLQLTDFKKKVEDVYEKESAERNRLAGQVVELQKQAQKIGEDAVNLAQALKGSSKTQGNWGEIILERLLEESGLQKGREYDTQVSFTKADGTRLMPDVVIHLPEAKDIVVDAKCSLLDYERFCAAESEPERQQYLNAHVSSLRSHIKSLSIKDYEKIDAIKSLDFVFIFIPIEAAFLFALQHDPSLYREAYDRHIILVSPTTLLATLRTVDNIWRHEKQNKNAERIAKEAGALHDQFVLLLDSLDNLGGYLNKTQEAYNMARERLQYGRGNLVKRVDDIRRLGAKTKKVIPEQLLEGAGVATESLMEWPEGGEL
jgi:DNA recombination protein RmuC